MSECLLLLAKLCIFDPANLSFSTQASWQLSGDLNYYKDYRKFFGTMGHLNIMVDVPITHKFEFRYGIEHRSFIDRKDRGEERAVVSLTWRPFQR